MTVIFSAETPPTVCPAVSADHQRGPRSQLSSLFRGRSCDLWGQKQSPPPQALAALASRRTPVCVSKGGGNRHLRSSCLLAPVLFFTCSNVCTSSCGPYNIQTKSPRPRPRKRSGRREGFQDFHPGRLTLVLRSFFSTWRERPARTITIPGILSVAVPRARPV